MSEYDDLISDEPPYDGQQPEEHTEEEPPAESEPPVIVIRNAFGPGKHSVRLPDGTPLGVHIYESQMAPDDVEEFCVSLGLDDDFVTFFVRNRRKGIAAERKLLAHPAIAHLAAQEGSRTAAMEQIRKEFIAKYKGRGKA